jgi:hypothetical protein
MAQHDTISEVSQAPVYTLYVGPDGHKVAMVVPMLPTHTPPQKVYPVLRSGLGGPRLSRSVTARY